jgi:hypothetical protein
MYALAIGRMEVWLTANFEFAVKGHDRRACRTDKIVPPGREPYAEALFNKLRSLVIAE